MTQKQKLIIPEKRLECLYEYLKFCEETDEPPRSEIIEPVMGCTDNKRFWSFKEAVKSKLEKFRNEKQ